MKNLKNNKHKNVLLNICTARDGRASLAGVRGLIHCVGPLFIGLILQVSHRLTSRARVLNGVCSERVLGQTQSSTSRARALRTGFDLEQSAVVSQTQLSTSRARALNAAFVVEQNNPSSLQSGLTSRARVLILTLVMMFVAPIFMALATTTTVSAAPSDTLNFQGRLLGIDGGLVADGYYNIEFNLYTAASGGSSIWTESREYNSGSGSCTGPINGNDCRVRVTNGYFSVYLGEVTALPNIDYSQQLYLTMNVDQNGTTSAGPITYDGEMNPRFKLTAVPYAFRAANVASGDTDSADSDDVNISTGDTTTSGTSGDIIIDNGAGATANGTINIGATNASGLLIGNAGATTTIQGSVALNGAGTALTVTNNAQFNGNVTVGSDTSDSLTVEADATFNGSLTVSTGDVFQNAGATLYSATAIADLPTGGAIGTAAATVDVATTFDITQTTAGQTLTLPTPTNTASGRVVYVNNIGSANFTMYGETIETGSSSTFIWNGSTWTTSVSFSNTGVDTVGALDGVAASANGATISGTTIYLQSASATAAGLVNTSAQTFAGTKTFNDGLVIAAGESLRVIGGNTASRPGAPSAGDLYYDTDTNQFMFYNGTKWIADQRDAIYVASTSTSSQADQDRADYLVDGTSDETEINTALTAATGAKVVLLEGTYVADGTILIPNNTTLSGVGNGTVIELADIDVTDNLIENSDTVTGTGVVIRDLKLDGRDDLNTAGTQYGIQFNGMGSGSGATARQGGLVENVTVDRARNRAIYLTASSNNTINNVRITRGNDGLYLSSSSNNFIDNVRITDGGNDGLYITGSSNNTISNILSQENGDVGVGIYSSSQNNVLTNIVSQNNPGYGINVASSAGNAITNSIVDSSGSYGVYLSGATETNFSNNQAIDNGGYGVYLDSSSNNNVISDNYIHGNAFAGIGLFSSNSNVVDGNRIDDNDGATDNEGIWIISADYNQISNNVISDTSCTTTCYAINISNAASDKNYLEGNRFSGSTTDAATINDAGTNTIYVNQQTNSTTSTNSDVTDFTFRGSADSTTAFEIQNAAGTNILTVDTTNSELEVTGAIIATGNLQIDGNTTLGDAVGDTLTVNAGSIQFANNFTSCTAITTDASGNLVCDTATYLTSASLTLQGAYAGGNTVTATDAEGDLDFTLNEATNFIIDVAGTGTFQVQDSGVAALTVDETSITLAQPTINIGSTVATAINIGNNSSTTTIDGGNVYTSGNTAVLSGNSFTVQSGSTLLTGPGTSANTLTVNNHTGTGNILEVQDAATPVFTIADGGAVRLQTSTDSVSGFQVLDADGGTAVFTVDTLNERVGIGTSAPVAGFEVATDVSVASNRALKWNAYYNGANDVYLANGSAVQQWQDEGADFYRFYAAAAGTAGNPISFQEAFAIDLNSATLGDVTFDGGTLYVDSSANAVSIGNSGTLQVAGLTTLNGGLTIEAGDTFTFNSDAFTDFTGGGLYNNSGVLSVTNTGASGFFQNGGNLFGTTATLGTNDVNPLVLRTNSTTALTIDTSQNITTAGNLDVAGRGAFGNNGSIGTTSLSQGVYAIDAELSVEANITAATDLQYTAATANVLSINPASNPATQAFISGSYNGAVIDASNTTDVGNLTLTGVLGEATAQGSGDIGVVEGGSFGATNSSTGTLTELRGSISAALNFGGNVSTLSGAQLTAANFSTSTVSSANGANVLITNVAGGTISNAKGVNVRFDNSAGTITNAAGVVVESVAGTNTTNLLLGTGTIPGGNYSIYNASTAANYFAGDLTLNQALSVNGNTTLGDASGDTLTVNAGSIQFANNFTSCTAITTDASGNLGCNTATLATSATAFINGGNDFGGNATLGTNTAGQTLALETANTTRFTLSATASTLTGNGATSILGGTTLNLGSTGANVLTLATNGTTRFTVANNASTITGNGATSLVGGSTLTLNAAATSALNLGTNQTTGVLTIGGTGAATGTINLGTGTGAQALNLGTGAGAKTVTLGSTNTTSSTVVQSGSGGISLSGNTTVTGSNTFTVGTGTTALGGALNTTGLATFNGGLTVEAGDTFTFNSDAFTDFTGGGLVNTGGVLSVDTTSASGFFQNGGNSFGGTATLGTNDANSLVFEVGGVDALTIADGGAITVQNETDSTTGFQVLDADGGIPVFNVDTANERVGIGTATPNAILEVAGASLTDQLRVTYNATWYTGLYTDGAGDFEINPNGGNTTIVGALSVTSNADVADLAVNGGDLTTTTTTFNLLNTNATTVNAFGVATTLSLGATSGTGTTTVNNSLTVNGSALFQNDTNSTSAFRINNAAGSSLLEADTTNYLLKVAPTQFISSGSTQNFGTSGSITGVDSFSTIAVNATAPGLNITLPTPAAGGQVVGRIVYVTAVNGSQDFTLELGGTLIDIAMKANSTATLIWNGTGWTAAGASSSTDLQSAYNNTLTSAGGAELVLNAAGGAADGLTIRNNATTPITGGLLEVQTSIGSNLFTVNNNATEYATNGGAETAGASASTFPANTWDTTTGGTVDRFTTTGANVATGQASVRVQTTATNHGARNRINTALTPGLTYTVSFAVRGAVNFSNLQVLYSPDGTTSGTTTCVTGATVTSGQWTRINCTFVASGTINSNNSILIRQTDGTARTFYIDNLSVNINAAATYAADGSVDSALGSNWTAYGAGVGVARDTTIIYDTNGSASATTPATANRGIRNNLSIVPQTNTQYLVSFFARSSTTITNDLAVGFLPTGGTGLPTGTAACTDYNTQTLPAGVWTKVTCLFTTTGTAITDADVVIYQEDASARTIYVDALTITLNTNNSNNVQVGGGNRGGPVTLFTLDRSAGNPIADNNEAYLGSMYYDTVTGRIQCYEADGWGACGAAPDNVVNLNPEYAGAVLNGSGVGTMTADFCSNDASLSVNPTFCGSGEAKNFYNWTSPQATEQTYSIYVTYQLPETFNGFSSDDTVQLVGRVDSTSNASVTYEMFRSTGSDVSQCGTGETDVIAGGGGSADTWYSYGINGNEATGCGLNASAAGDFVIFKINLKAQSNANAYVSTLSFVTTGR